MPYRLAGRPRQPESPDVDENLLRKPWSAGALLISLVYAPLVTWGLVMGETGSGPRQFTPGTKVVIAVAFTLWIVVLLVLRARHERRLQAAVARMEQATAEDSRLRIADEPDGPREHPLAVDDEDHDEAPQAKRRG